MGTKFTKVLRRLMGAKSTEATHEESEQAVEYMGYMIRPAARRQGSQWVTAGVITKQFADQVKEHHFIRADVYSAKDDADACAIAKGKRIIDERGDGLFEES